MQALVFLLGERGIPSGADSDEQVKAVDQAISIGAGLGVGQAFAFRFGFRLAAYRLPLMVLLICCRVFLSVVSSASVASTCRPGSADCNRFVIAPI